jgi:hypothetical protein
MYVRVWSEVKGGVDKTHIEIDTFTAPEQTQADSFGPIVVNLGGAHQGTVTGGASPVVVDFILEPIQLVINPIVDGAPVLYDRDFLASADYAVPGACAKQFCTDAMAKITAAYNTWKSQTTAYVVNLTQTLS